MQMKTIYGYVQEEINEIEQNIEERILQLNSMGANRKNIFIEQKLGKKPKKSELKRLLDVIQPGDTLVCTEILQIARSTKKLCNLMEIAKERQIKLVIGNFVVDCRKELNLFTEGMFKMADVFSGLERNIISHRVKNGLNNAKARGKMVGRPSLKFENIPKKVIDHYQLLENGALNKTEYAKICYISRPTLDKYLALMKNTKWLE